MRFTCPDDRAALEPAAACQGTFSAILGSCFILLYYIAQGGLELVPILLSQPPKLLELQSISLDPKPLPCCIAPPGGPHCHLTWSILCLRTLLTTLTIQSAFLEAFRITGQRWIPYVKRLSRVPTH